MCVFVRGCTCACVTGKLCVCVSVCMCVCVKVVSAYVSGRFCVKIVCEHVCLEEGL